MYTKCNGKYRLIKPRCKVKWVKCTYHPDVESFSCESQSSSQADVRCCVSLQSVYDLLGLTWMRVEHWEGCGLFKGNQTLYDVREHKDLVRRHWPHRLPITSAQVKTDMHLKAGKCAFISFKTWGRLQDHHMSNSGWGFEVKRQMNVMSNGDWRGWRQTSVGPVVDFS